MENLAKTDIQKLKIKSEGLEINAQFKPEVKYAITPRLENKSITKQAIAPPTEPNLVPDKPENLTENKDTEGFETIKSPMVGTFYRKPSPNKPVFVEVGQKIKKGEVICIIEAMKLFNEIESEIDGEIAKILIKDSSPVEYNQPLFLVKS